MDKDRIKGKGKDLGGRAQEAWGDLTNDAEHKIKGQAKQVEGNVQEGFGKVKDAIRDAMDDKPGRDRV
jgi:uncharacterized protein YjbJ (UPF0337 family)